MYGYSGREQREGGADFFSRKNGAKVFEKNDFFQTNFSETSGPVDIINGIFRFLPNYKECGGVFAEVFYYTPIS